MRRGHLGDTVLSICVLILGPYACRAYISARNQLQRSTQVSGAALTSSITRAGLGVLFAQLFIITIAQDKRFIRIRPLDVREYCVEPLRQSRASWNWHPVKSHWREVALRPTRQQVLLRILYCCSHGDAPSSLNGFRRRSKCLKTVSMTHTCHSGKAIMVFSTLINRARVLDCTVTSHYDKNSEGLHVFLHTTQRYNREFR
jgi:hypothetical protein